MEPGPPRCYISLAVCRFFGQHAVPGVDPIAPLCSAENALRFQSHAHPHGWGIGWYRRGDPVLRRGLLPAHADDAFVEAAREVRSDVVVAHIRDASIGPVSDVNTHPFRHGRWLFAHNGTLARYERSAEVRAAILAEIDPALRSALEGETDSERCFLMFLGRLRARAPLEDATLPQVRQALAETTEAIVRICDPGAEKRSTLNFLVTDGRLLAACRRGKTLHLAVNAGLRRAFVLASERIGEARWEEIPEGGFAGTEDGAQAARGTLGLADA